MRARGNSHKLLQVTFQLPVRKTHNDRVAAHRDCWIPIHFRTQPEKQPDLTFKSALLWEGGWTRWPPEVHSNTSSSIILSTPNQLKKNSLVSVSSYSKKAKWNLIQLKKNQEVQNKEKDFQKQYQLTALSLHLYYYFQQLVSMNYIYGYSSQHKTVFMKQVLIVSNSWDQSRPITGGQAVPTALVVGLHRSSSEIEEAREIMDLIQHRHSVPKQWSLYSD